MDILKSFVTNKPVKEAVYNYMVEALKEEIVNRALQEKDITGYAEAKRIIDKAFNNLEGKYGDKNRSSQDSR
jgi:hydroxylamine reductase (hybrid-cluster protein)